MPPKDATTSEHVQSYSIAALLRSGASFHFVPSFWPACDCGCHRCHPTDLRTRELSRSRNSRRSRKSRTRAQHSCPGIRLASGARAVRTGPGVPGVIATSARSLAARRLDLSYLLGGDKCVAQSTSRVVWPPPQHGLVYPGLQQTQVLHPLSAASMPLLAHAGAMKGAVAGSRASESCIETFKSGPDEHKTTTQGSFSASGACGRISCLPS